MSREHKSIVVLVVISLIVIALAFSRMVERDFLADFCQANDYDGWTTMERQDYCWRYMEGDDILMRPIDKIKQGGE